MAVQMKSSIISPFSEVLDALALALVSHDHDWTDEERQLYELAVAICDDCMEIDSLVSTTYRVH